MQTRLPLMLWCPPSPYYSIFQLELQLRVAWMGQHRRPSHRGEEFENGLSLLPHSSDPHAYLNMFLETVH